MRVLERFTVCLAMIACLVAPAATYAQAVDPAALIEKLGDPTQREEAAKTLVSLGPDAVEMLDEALSSRRTNDFVRREVLRLLPAFGEAGVRVVKRALEDPGIELEAIRQLAELQDAGLETLMTDRLKESLNPRVRYTALEWLAANGDAGKFNKLLYEVLSDASDRVREKAAELVAERLGVKAVPKLMEMLRQAEFNKSPANRGLRTALVLAMGNIGQSGPADAARVVPTILRSLGEEDEKSVAVDALIAIGAPSVSSLLMILKAGDTKRAAAAMDALLAIGQKAAPEVVSLLQARHPKMKRMASQFLGFYQDPAVFPLLRDLYPRVVAEDKIAILRIASLYDSQETHDFISRATLDEDPIVRGEAVQILSSTGETSVVPVVLTRAEEDSDQDIRIAAIKGIFSMGAASAVTTLGRMLEYEKWPVRYELLQALAFMATPANVKAVSDQLRHRRSEVANAAGRALANITYMSGERTPDEWVRDVGRVIGGEEGAEIDSTQKSLAFGDETLEVIVLGNSREYILYLAPSLSPNPRSAKTYLSKLADKYSVIVMPFDGCPMHAGEQQTADVCFKRHAERMELVRQEVAGKKVVVLTQGLTGFAGMAYAAAYPDALTSLVIADPIFPRREHVERTLEATITRLPVRWAKELQFVKKIAGDLLPFARNSYISRIELAAQIRAEGRAMLVASGAYGMSWFLAETFFPFADTSLETSLANVKVPILLVIGADDYSAETNLPAFRRIGRIRRNLVSTRLNGVVRWAMVEQSETFQMAMLRFLQSYRVGYGQPTGVGGKWPSGKVAHGEVGQFEESLPVASVPADLAQRDGDLVESSRLTRFLTANTPGKVADGTSVDDLAAQREAAQKAEAERRAASHRAAISARLEEEAKQTEEARQAAAAARAEEEARWAEETARLEAEREALAAERRALEEEKRENAIGGEQPLAPGDGRDGEVVAVEPPVPSSGEEDTHARALAAEEARRVAAEARMEEARQRAAAEALEESKKAEQQTLAAQVAAEAARQAAAAEALAAQEAKQAEEAARTDEEKAAAAAASEEAARAAEEARLAAAEQARAEEMARRAAQERSLANAANSIDGAQARGGSTVVAGGGPDKLTYVGWGLLSGGVLLTGGGVFMGITAGQHAADANNLDATLPDYDAQFDAELASAQTWQALALVSYGVGAVSLLIGLDLLLDWPVSFRKSTPAAAWSLQPVAVPGGGLMLFQWGL